MILKKEKIIIIERARIILGTYNSTIDKRRNKLYWFSAIKYIMKSNKNLFND
jgi:hypothetical protein